MPYVRSAIFGNRCPDIFCTHPAFLEMGIALLEEGFFHQIDVRRWSYLLPSLLAKLVAFYLLAYGMVARAWQIYQSLFPAGRRLVFLAWQLAR